MKLELKNIQLNKRLSEETPCYTASLWLEGTKVAEVANRGHGGGDEVHWLVKDAEAKIDAYFASLPPETYHGHELQPDLETWCHEVVWDQDLLKSVKADLRRKVILLTPDHQEVRFKTLKPEDLAKPEILRQIKERYPDAVILNLLDENTLVARLKQAVKQR